MEEDSDGRHKPCGPGGTEVNGGSGPGDGTKGATAGGLGAGGGGGDGSGRRAPTCTGGGGPPPQDDPIGEIGKTSGGGGGWGGPPRSAPSRDLPTDAGGGGGKLQSLLDATLVVGSNEKSPEHQQRVVSGPDDAAGGVAGAGADKGRLGAELSTGGNNVARVRDAVQSPSVHEYSVTDDRPTPSSAASAQVVAAQPALRAKKSRRPDSSDDDPTESGEYCEDGESVEDEVEQEQQRDDELVKTKAARSSDRGETRRRKKKKSGATSRGGANSGSSATGSTRSTRRSDLNNRLEEVGVGTRVGIYWPLDHVFYPATIIAKHGRWHHTYTFLYDDGEQESFDLSKHQQFQILDDEVPKEALAAIATASEGGGDQNGCEESLIAAGRSKRKAATANSNGDTAESEEQVGDWVCPTCKTTNPYEKKHCQCPSTRKKENGKKRIALCAIPDCSKQSQGLTSNSMCQRHFKLSNNRRDGDGSGDGVDIAEKEISSKKRARKAPDRFDGQEIAKANSFDDGDHKSEAKKPKRSKSAFRSNNKNELSVDEISNLRSRQSKSKPSDAKTSIGRGARVSGSSGDDGEISEEDDGEDWICLGCGIENASKKKRCPPPCLKWKGGCRNITTSPAKKKESPTAKKKKKKKDPYAGLKRRDSPRRPSKNQCGQCNACMVDDCGDCKFCLDMPRFGGPWRSRQKCLDRPPCENPPSMSSVKKSKSRAPVSLSERASRAGRPPRAKPVPPAPPAGSIALDPLKLADAVDVPKSTESCEWSFDEKSRVLLAKFILGSSSSIDPVQKEILLKMMERDDITVVSEGLVGDLNPTLWDMHYVSNLVGDKPYHKVRRFERELIGLPFDKSENESDESDTKIAGEGSANSTAAVAAAAAAVQLEDVAGSATGTSTSAEEESSSMDPRQRFHVRHKEVDKNLCMKISDYCKYLDKRSTALQSIVEKRSKKGVDPVNPASREDDLIGRSTDVEGQNPESFTFLTHDGKEETINVVDEVLYLIDYDMVKLLPPLYEDFVNKFKLPDCLPGGQQCMMNAVNINGRPFMGPNFCEYASSVIDIVVLVLLFMCSYLRCRILSLIPRLSSLVAYSYIIDQISIDVTPPG